MQRIFSNPVFIETSILLAFLSQLCQSFCVKETVVHTLVPCLQCNLAEVGVFGMLS